ncbi:HU family DNA-binding protein [Undibacterium luofuense]|uniref:HU family DNA-binding protein n=1 Tax=Undibacterium luofuense TaxID=2828733 RepID=UPI0030ECF7F8
MCAIRQSTTTAAAAACGCLLSVLMLMPAVAGAAELANTDISPYLPVAGGTFKSVLSGTGLQSEIRVSGFLMRRDPVSQQDFLQFVQKNPQWRKDRIPSLFADKAYLAQWPAADSFGAADSASPVTGISWFAARAYCQSEQARLPRWYEWELAAAADVPNKTAKALVTAYGELAVKETKKNGVAVLPGLGRLVRVERKARMGRNPATGETIKIAAKKVVKFRVAKAVKDAIVPPKKK